MPEANQYMFNHRELTTLLIKEAGLHEGRWIVSLNFGLSGGNFGPTPEQMAPGAVLAVLQVGIQRALPETPEGMVVDASKVNPETTKPSKKL